MREQPTFLLRLRPVPGVDAVKALRAALKKLLRQFGLRAVSIEIEPPYAPPDPAQHQPTKAVAEQQRTIRSLSRELRELRRGGAR